MNSKVNKLENIKDCLSNIALGEFVEYVDELSEIIQNDDKCMETIRICDEKLILNPKDIESYDRIGFCLSMLQKYFEAIESYDKILEIDTNNKKAYNSKGLP